MCTGRTSECNQDDWVNVRIKQSGADFYFTTNPKDEKLKIKYKYNFTMCSMIIRVHKNTDKQFVYIKLLKFFIIMNR